jgi:hypothetical protein
MTTVSNSGTEESRQTNAAGELHCYNCGNPDYRVLK